MNSSVVSQMCKSLGSRPVRGSYSAKVPRSSFARVRRVLVPHIMEEKGEEQDNVKEHRREDGQQRVEGSPWRIKTTTS